MITITQLSVPFQPDWDSCYRVSRHGIPLGIIDYDGQQYWATGNFGEPTPHPTMEAAIASFR